jgi:ParB-like chromosome segregation protein Spo0J
MAIGLEPDEYQRLLLSVGTHRRTRPLSPVEVGALLAKAESSGHSRAKIASAVGIASSEVIRRFLLLLKLDPSVQALVGWGRQEGSISFANAAELARLPRSDQMAAAKAILEYGLSNAEVEEMVQIRQRSGSGIDFAIEAVLKRRPSVERQYLFVGQISEQAAATFEALEPDARAAAIGRVTADAFPQIAHSLKVRVVGDRVTLFSKSDVRESLGSDFDVRFGEAATKAAKI